MSWTESLIKKSSVIQKLSQAKQNSNPNVNYKKDIERQKPPIWAAFVSLHGFETVFFDHPLNSFIRCDFAAQDFFARLDILFSRREALAFHVEADKFKIFRNLFTGCFVLPLGLYP